METKKRKREESVPLHSLITYYAPGRTFERLFKEKTLEDTKRVVRGKLGLDNDVCIKLEQIRDGRVIDLEDDDDFAALSVMAQSVSTVEVRVTVPTSDSVNAPPNDLTKVSKNPKKRKRAQTPGPTPTPVELPTNRNANRAQSQPPASEPSKKRKILESMIESGGITPINPPPIMTKRKRNSGGPQPQSAGPKLHVEDEGNKEEKEQSVPEPKKILKRKATNSNLKEKVVTFEPIASTSSLPPPTHEELHKKKEAGKGEADQGKVTESGKVKKTSGSKGKGKEDAVESVNVPAVEDAQPSSVQKKTKKKLPTAPPSAEVTSAEPQLLSLTTRKGVPILPTPLKGTLNTPIEPGVHEGCAGKRRKRQKKTTPEDLQSIANALVASEELAVTKKSKDQKTEISKASPEMLAAAQAHLEAYMTSKLGSSSKATEPRKDGDGEQPLGSKSKHKSKGSLRKKTVAEPEPEPVSELPKVDPASSTSHQKPTLASLPSSSPIDEAPPLASQHAFGSDEQPCPICQEGPFHLRYNCPTIKAGPEALEKRIKELREGAARGKGPAMQWQNLPEELDIILKQMKARIGLSRPAVSIKSSTTMRLPNGSTISEVTVENEDEGSSNETSNDDDNEDEEDDEEAQPSRQDWSSSPYKISGPTDLENLDIEALIRGPASQSKSVLDDIPSRSDSENKDDEEDAEEVEEDEENDREYRRRAKRLEKVAASSDENDDDAELSIGGDGDIDVGGAIAPLEISPELGNSVVAHGDVSQQAMDGSIGSLGEDSEKTKVASSEENGHNSDISVFDCDPLKAKGSETLLAAALDFLDGNPPPQDESRPVSGHPKTLSKTTEDIITVNDSHSEPKHKKDDSDPIESADESDKDQTPPRQTSARATSQSPRKPGTAKRMKTRSGKLPSNDPLDRLPTSTLLPDINAAVQPSTTHGASSVDVVPPPKVPETNAPAKRGRRPLTSEEKAAREKAKVEETARKAAAKQAEGGVKVKQRTAAALAKKSANKVSSKTPNGTTSTLQHAESTGPLTNPEKASQPPQPVTRWASIDGISPKSNNATSQLDELHSGSKSGSAKAASQGPTDRQAPVRPGSKPLFLPSDSQSHFPYSQFQIDTSPAQQAQEDDNLTESDFPSEANTTLQPKPTPRLTSSVITKYRRLTDIASQEILSPSAMSPLNYFLPTPTVNKSKVIASNKEDDDEDIDNSLDDSASDSDTDVKSHIPKSRRAGRVLRSRKKSGLLSYA